MIIATAGHVDHGKTLLVKALTGVDTDRLPEEKKRGMTIDLGFAYLPLGDAPTIGFIDVPGHERFIRNMLCGVAGIDFVLFVIAADDGPMPQSIEHLLILDLLAVRHGAVALTKIDRVGADRVTELEAEITVLLAGTSLAGAPIFPVSAATGAGLRALKQHLAEIARALPPRRVRGNFRLSVDRCFTVTGAGMVVTGTVVAGAVAIGDQVRVQLADRAARVRGIHAQSRPAQSGAEGERCALNLVGPDFGHGAVERGDWIVTGAAPVSPRKIDVRVRVLAREPRALAHWTPVHLHLGAADVTGRVALLEAESLLPGQSGLAQLVLDRPIGALRGDGFIIRDQSALRTIGGGRVIDIFPPARGRARPERLAYLAAMEEGDDAAALARLLDLSPLGLNLQRFAANRNLTAAEAALIFASVPMKPVATAAGTLGFSGPHWQRLKASFLETLAAWHRRSPDTTGPAEDRIFAGSRLRVAREAAGAVAAELAREGAVIRDGAGIRLPQHQPSLKPADAVLWKKLMPLLPAGALHPPSLHEIAAALGEDPATIESLLVRVARLGVAIRVTKNRFFRPEGLGALGRLVEDLAAQSPDRRVTAAALRDRAGIGRNVAIEVLEYFDKVKFTRRVGDAHELLRRAADAFGDAEAAAGIDSPVQG